MRMESRPTDRRNPEERVTKRRRASEPRRFWTAREDALLRRRYPHEPTAALAATLKRSVEAVYGRAKSFGLSKSDAYLASPAACRLRRGDEVGKAFRFKPGQVPPNKGLRHPPGWAPGRMKDTQFKKGMLNGVAAARLKPIGSLRTCDGYLYRKLSAMPGPWTRNWKLEHILIWERANGPIQKGHALAFKNGDRTDVRLENLECITRRALMKRNSVHNLPKPIAQVVQLIGALNRQIRRRTRGKKQDRRSA
jgi:HNH endonuclease